MTAYEDLGITAFDAADYLETEEAQIAFLNDAAASGDAGVFASAIGAVTRARSRSNGMGELARKTGIKRQTLNKSLGPKGNPTVETLLSVWDALGLRMMVAPKAQGGARKARAAARTTAPAHRPKIEARA